MGVHKKREGCLPKFAMLPFKRRGILLKIGGYRCSSKCTHEDSCQHLRECVTQESFQVPMLETVLKDFTDQLGHLVQDFCMLPCSLPNTDGIVNHYDGKYQGNCKKRRVNSVGHADTGSKSYNSGSVRRGHSSSAKGSTKANSSFDNELENELQNLGNDKGEEC